METREPKRPRLAGTLVSWKAQQSGNKYTVVLSKPEEGDICNIMQEEIATASLDWVCPSIDYFVKGDPGARKATLPCKHIFYATAIAYHFRKNGMRCPVCRKGEDNAMNAQGIPKHLRAVITQRANETNAREGLEELQEVEENNMQVIQHIIHEELVDVVMAYRPRIPMHSFRAAEFSLVYTTHYPPADPTDDTDALFGFPMRCIPGTSLEFAVPRSHLRNLSRFLQSTSPSAITLSIACNDNIICTSRPINIPMFLEDGRLNTAAGATAVLTPHPSGETTTLSTPTIHFMEHSEEEYIFRGQLFLQMAQPGGRANTVFPVEGLRWVPDITELTHVMLENVT